MKKLLFGLVLVGLALGPVQDALQDGHSPMADLAGALNQTQQQQHVDATCEGIRISTGETECEIELRSPAELAAQAGQG